MPDEKNEEPLTVTYNNSKPPWIGLWTRRHREYNGRKEWWSELGHSDELVQAGKWRQVRARYREEDPDWWDKKVEDGTSVVGPFGLDSTKYPNYTKKADTPGSVKEFQDNVYKNTRQYRAIAEKWKLSKEHPGFGTSPTLSSLEYHKKSWLGRNGIVNNSWFHLGPHFFNKPMNEGTFEKGLACAKYAAIVMLPWTMFEIKAFETVKVDLLTPTTFMYRYFQLAPVPVAIAFTWGVAISLTANLRHKDDLRNHVYASAAVGTVLGAMQKNMARGITLSIVSLIAGTFWHYTRLQQFGLHGMAVNQQTGGWWGGPMAWKFFQQGDIKVPTTKY